MKRKNYKYWSTKILIGILLSSLLTVYQPALAGRPVPDTGQTTCYDDAGNVITPCPQSTEPFYGQDANYNINPTSYTKLDVNGDAQPESATSWVMVEDNVTGLVWEVKTDDESIHDRDNTYTWYDANPKTNGGDPGLPGDGTDTSDFVSSLNTSEFGTFSDWRLPAIEELRSIVNYNDFGKAINLDYFPGTTSLLYWSSTNSVEKNYRAWCIFFKSGHDDFKDKPINYNLRAVRAQRAHPYNSLILNGDGTVTDTRNGLMWQESTGYSGARVTWSEALAYCENLTDAGYEDWRLPNQKELNAIVDWTASPAINATCFSAEPSVYWSSTTHASQNDYAWCVNFSNGYDNHYLKANTAFIRAVRGGQNKIENQLFITSPRQASKWSKGSIMPIVWNNQSLGGNVAISLYRNGLKETIIANTANDGYYEWIVDGAASVNCELKIESIEYPSKETTQGIFMIGDYVPVTPTELIVSEPMNGIDQTVMFKIRLICEPTGIITIDLHSSNPGECSVYPETVKIDAANWNTGVDVEVTGEYDGLIDGPQKCSIVTSSTRSNDGYFNEIHIANVRVIVQDAYSGPAIYSVYPTYGIVDQPMNIEVTGSGFTADQVSLFLVPEIEDDIPIIDFEINNDNSITANLSGQIKEGDYGIKISGNVGLHEIKDAITISNSEIINLHNQKKAIIIAGGGPLVGSARPGEHSYPYNLLWDATKKCADMAYYSLFSQGYTSDNIYYLNHQEFIDITGNGENDVDAEADIINIAYAFNIWARESAPPAELIVYLVGPGSNEAFIVKYGEKNEILTANELDDFLDDLQSVSPVMTGNIILVYDACMSGSFIPLLKGENRIVMAGASQNERAWFLDDGELSFSYIFWRNIFNKGRIDHSFIDTKNIISAIQTPLMDSNGDGVPDNAGKRSSSAILVGRGRQVDSQPPKISSAMSNPSILNGTTESEIIATGVHAPNEVGRVWARIIPPEAYFESNDQPVLIVPTCKLSEKSGEYRNTFREFLYTGSYSVFVYVKDRLDFQSLPVITRLTQQDGVSFTLNPILDINGNNTIDLIDLIIILKAITGEDISDLLWRQYKPPAFDLDGDSNIGLPEVINIMKVIAG